MCIFCERFRGKLDLDDDAIMDAEACEALRARRKKAMIITGFLGAGKTTFLNYLLKADHGKKIAVVICEFGTTTVDEDLLEGEARKDLSDDPENMQVVSLDNGCLCCTVREDLYKALKDLNKANQNAVENGEEGNNNRGGMSLNFDYLLIECSGMAEVLPMAQTFYNPDIQEMFTLDSVICVVDAKSYSDNLADQWACMEIAEIDDDPSAPVEVFPKKKPVIDITGEESKKKSPFSLISEQLALADVVLLNKIDLVEKSERNRVANDIREKNGSVDIIPCKHARVSLDQVLDQDRFAVTKDMLNKKTTHAYLETAGVMSVSAEVGDERLDLVKLRSFISDLYMRYYRQKVVRCKGVVRVLDGATTTYTMGVQGVGDHVELDMIGGVNEAEPEDAPKNSKFVVIFQDPTGIDADAIRSGFVNCRVSVARAERDGMEPARKMMMAASSSAMSVS